jgi:SAM-dependent methyltransferase
MARRGSYGVDAPYVPIIMLGGASAMFAVALWQALHGVIALWWWIPAAYLAASGACYLYTTRRGKFRVWDELLGSLALRGDERVLDVGCGRGAVLLALAARVPAGKASGIDLWSRADQSGNGEDVTRRNAELEGVAARVELHTGDMRKMPFADAAFDVVVSSLAIHNIPSAEERAAAIDEIVRVTAAGGQIVLADIRHVEAYAARLRERGCGDVTVRGLGWRFWFGGPFWSTRVTSARRA